jgi:hypothetical protein
MPTVPFTVICGSCPYRDPAPTRGEAVASALRHRAKHPSHVVVVKDPTGLTLAERFFSN